MEKQTGILLERDSLHAQLKLITIIRENIS